MPGNRRRQQHRGQRPQRQRRYRSGGQGQAFKPGFPMNLFTGRVALISFVVVGVMAMAGGLVLSVLLNPDQAPVSGEGEVEATAEATATAPAAPDSRVYSAAEIVTDATAETYTATIATAKGDIVIELFADVAPNTVNSFVFLAEQGYFDGIVFHRVVENFIVQGGDPTGSGTGGPGYVTADEPNELHNEAGTISMAKVLGQSVFGSQFFINLKDNPSLDFDSGNSDRFYPFGRVIEGMDIAHSLALGDVIESIAIARTPLPDAPPPEEGDADGEGAEGEAEDAGADGG